jgi:VanZ family protein
MKLIMHYHKTILLSFLILFLSLYNFSGISRVIQIFPHEDKVVHFLMYFAIAITVLFEHNLKTGRTDRKRLTVNIYPLILGALLEIIQKVYTVNRSGDWLDFAADISGILAANLIFLLIRDVKFFRRIIRFPF